MPRPVAGHLIVSIPISVSSIARGRLLTDLDFPQGTPRANAFSASSLNGGQAFLSNALDMPVLIGSHTRGPSAVRPKLVLCEPMPPNNQRSLAESVNYGVEIRPFEVAKTAAMQPSWCVAIPQSMQRHTGCQSPVDAKPAKFDPVPKPDKQDVHDRELDRSKLKQCRNLGALQQGDSI